MAVYVYIYSDYPANNPRKYYVGDYRKRNAYTYQVVPQLQRAFDRREFAHKTELDEERFERLRRHGHLYTEKREGDRSPLYTEVDPRELPEEWRPFGAWLAGERAPAEVHWRELGGTLRRALGSGRRLPEVLAQAVESIETDAGRSFAGLYEAIRIWNLGKTWYHRADEVPPEWLARAESRDWDRSAVRTVDSAGPTPSATEQYDLETLVRESRPPRAPLDEPTWRAEMADALELRGDRRWGAIAERLGDPSSRYETVDRGKEGTLRVPTDDLYEVQWQLARMLSEAGLHHACAPALEIETPAALHARFHAGARGAAIVQLDGYPEGIEMASVRSELSMESNDGVFAGWSDEGLRTLAELLVDPDRGRLSSAAPSSTATAEFVLWNLDDRLGRRADDGWGEVGEWAYSRFRDELVVSTRERGTHRVLSAVVSSISEMLDRRSLGIAEGGVRLWRSNETPLEVGELVVPAERRGDVEVPRERRSRLDQSVERARRSEEDDGDRRLLEEVYRITGDIRYASLGIPAIGSDVRDLLAAVALRDFREQLLDGWYGAVGTEADTGRDDRGNGRCE